MSERSRADVIRGAMAEWELWLTGEKPPPPEFIDDALCRWEESRRAQLEHAITAYIHDDKAIAETFAAFRGESLEEESE